MSHISDPAREQESREQFARELALEVDNARLRALVLEAENCGQVDYEDTGCAWCDTLSDSTWHADTKTRTYSVPHKPDCRAFSASGVVR